MAEEKKEPGRPRELPGPGARMSIWLPISEYDRLAKEAGQQHQSMSAFIRQLLAQKTGT